MVHVTVRVLSFRLHCLTQWIRINENQAIASSPLGCGYPREFCVVGQPPKMGPMDDLCHLMWQFELVSPCSIWCVLINRFVIENARQENRDAHAKIGGMYNSFDLPPQT